MNADIAKTWPNITQKGEPPPDDKEGTVNLTNLREIFQS